VDYLEAMGLSVVVYDVNENRLADGYIHHRPRRSVILATVVPDVETLVSHDYREDGCARWF
jgi:hypothetical protein